MMVVASELKYKVYCLDVAQAFTKADSDCVVYVKLSDGCGELSGKFDRLEKDLYGLRLLWNDLLVVKLVNVHGMEQCKTDPCVVFRPMWEGKVVLILTVHAPGRRYGRSLPLAMLQVGQVLTGLNLLTDGYSAVPFICLLQYVRADICHRRLGHTNFATCSCFGGRTPTAPTTTALCLGATPVPSARASRRRTPRPPGASPTDRSFFLLGPSGEPLLVLSTLLEATTNGVTERLTAPRV